MTFLGRLGVLVSAVIVLWPLTWVEPSRAQILVGPGGRADDKALSAHVKGMTVSQFVDECRGRPVDCLTDAGGVAYELMSREFVRSLDDKPFKPHYCEPKQTDNETRRDVLLLYFDKHPELGAQPLLDGGLFAFTQAWAGECDAEDLAQTALSATLKRMTVSSFLTLCAQDASACTKETLDLYNEAVSLALPSIVDDGADPPFCKPKQDPAGIGAALVAYFQAHPEMGESRLIDAGQKALVALWPWNGGKC